MSRKSDPVATFLRARGCPAFVVDGGIERLLGNWEALVGSLATVWPFGLEDWLNDLDGRRLLGEIATAVSGALTGPVGERLRAADALFKKRTRPLAQCLWGPKAAAQLGITAEDQWWYFRVPKKSAVDLLAEAGLAR
ncbi:MAG: hypothetical protein IPK26_06095 [Planctomycetes bacterium]|nr:hypothetical protein [Planctomycetota bacterium]